MGPLPSQGQIKKTGLPIAPVGPSFLAMAENYLTEHRDGVCLAVKLQPRASKNEIGPALGQELKIKVTAPPVDDAANQALVELLAETFDCARSSVQILRGRTSQHKTVLIAGMKAEEVVRKLQQ